MVASVAMASGNLNVTVTVDSLTDAWKAIQDSRLGDILYDGKYTPPSLHVASAHAWGGRAEHLHYTLEANDYRRQYRPRKDPWVEFWGEMDSDEGPIMNPKAMEKEIARLRGELEVLRLRYRDQVVITRDQAKGARDMIAIWKIMKQNGHHSIDMDEAVSKFESEAVGTERGVLEAALAMVRVLHETGEE